MAMKFKKMGVANMAIGLNANDKNYHDQITRVPGSFDLMGCITVLSIFIDSNL
jgi:MoaA/NifB/PqqE/SkfB family radical SAM enzyme